jgi:hypothetical protein
LTPTAVRFTLVGLDPRPWFLKTEVVMSKSLRCLLAVGLLMSLAPFAAAQDDEARALALVKKAVAAQGGYDKLSQKVASHRKTRGVFHADKFTFTGESYGDLGNRRKIVLSGDQDGQSSTRTLVMEDGKGWISFDGFTVDLDDEFLQRLERSAHADKVSGLVTLLRDKGYKLSTLGEVQIKDRPALGVKVEKEGMPDVQLYFDRATGLLVKSANKTKDSEGAGEVLQEVYYTDYQWYSPVADDEQLLRAAKLSVTGPGLVQALRRRVATPDELERIAPLIDRLGHRLFNVRQSATNALAGWGTKATVLLREALSHKDGEVARRAEKLLEQIAEDRDAELAAAQLRLIAVRRPEGAVGVLLDYLAYAPDEKSSKLVLEALAAVAVRGGKADRELERALVGQDPKRYQAAAAVLGKDGGAFAKQPWRPVLVDGVLLSRSCSLYRDGKLHMDLESVEVHYYNRLDDSVFARP